MSDRGTNEAEQVKRGLAENDESPWEWGLYIERCDNGDWIPLVYGGCEDFEDARSRWLTHCRLATSAPSHLRRPRIVRRAVGPWEVRDEP